MSENLIEMKEIVKSFPGVRALDGVSFTLRAREVHALLGENGAGKSTLMKILAGIYQRDDGEFKVDGVSVGDLNPKLAQQFGIAIIHQELNMCQHLTVAENIFLGREETNWGVINQKKLNDMARAALEKLNLDIEPEMVIGELPVSKQQMVEIAKAISTNCKVLVMDEPTSALTAREVTELNRVIIGLKARGCGIVYISHRLEDLAPIVDRVTILRDGRYVVTKDFKETSIPEIISYMVGREIKNKYPTVSETPGKEIMRVENLTTHSGVKDMSFILREGEILAFSGLMGAGRTELLRALFGVDEIYNGRIILDGDEVKIKSPQDAISAGIVCAPEDRKKEGLCVELPIYENIGMANLDKTAANVLGFVNRKSESDMTARAIDELKIKTPSQHQEAKNLSGGNQQKVVVGKWMVRDARVFMFDEPTRGIDVAAKIEIYHLMNKLKQQGFGVMFVSSEMPEVLGMADRILVVCGGRITGELSREEATQEKIMEFATKFESKAI